MQDCPKNRLHPAAAQPSLGRSSLMTWTPPLRLLPLALGLGLLSSCSLVHTPYRPAVAEAAPAPAPPPPPRDAGAGAPLKASYNSCKVNGPYVAMTFDDGPHATHTPRLLRMLRERNLKATFFLIGTSVDAYPQIVRQILADGHEVANHTRTHASLTKLSDAGVARELSSCNASIAQAANGYRPQVFRPPYGAITSRQKEWILQEYGMPSIMWSVDPLDWKYRNSARVARELINGAHPGAILLAHDIHGTTIDAMPEVFDTLQARGYRFVTVSELINLERSGSPGGPPLALNFAAGNF